MPRFGVVSESPNRPERPAASSISAALNRADEPPARSASPAASSLSIPQDTGATLPFIMACILVFMEIGRPFDQFLIGYHIPAVIGAIGIVVTLFSDWPFALKSRVGVPLVLFSLILALTSLTSIWRGASFAYTQQFIELDLVVFCIVAAAPKTLAQIRWLIFMVVFGIIFNFLAGYGFDPTGRLILTDASFGNSDEVGVTGGFAIPLVILLCSRLNRVLGIILGVCGVLASLLVVGLSATRFALVALVVTVIVYLFRSSGGQRILILIALGIVLVASVAFLPKSSIQRFGTIMDAFNSGADQDLSNEAIGSLYERQQLSKDAITCFLTHPLWGVGPNNFSEWRWAVLHLHSQPPHNVFLQTAAEEGIVGAILYTIFLVMAVTTFQRTIKPEPGWEEGATLSMGLQLCMIYFIACSAFFNSQVYVHQFIIAGLGVSLFRIRQIGQQQQQPQLAAAEIGAKSLPQLQRTRQQQLPKATSPTAAAAATSADDKTRYRFNRPVTLSGRKDKQS